jgi:hypothetical protein
MENRDISDLVMNVLVHSSLLIENLDALGETPIFKRNLKMLGNRFKDELESTANNMHKNIGSENDSQRAVAELYDSYYNIISKTDKLTIEQRHVVATAIGDIVNMAKEGKKIGIIEI